MIVRDFIMSNKLISIIVPIYNVEQYLTKCVESLINQTYKNIEIILVDDGSTDNSGIIADRLAKKDARIKIFHKENGGLSDARNYGVNKASSDLIMFIDSDDYYELFAVEYLVRVQERYNSDLVASGLESVNKYNIFKDINIYEKDIDEALYLTKEQALENMFYAKSFSSSACGKLIKKDLLLKYPYPKGKLFEDMATTYKHIHGADRIYSVPIKVYKYFKRDGSIVNSKFNPAYLYIFDIMNDIYKFLNENYRSSSIIRAANVRNVFLSMELRNTMLRANMYNEVKNIQKRILLYKYDFFVNSEVSFKNKLKALMFIISPKFYNNIRKSLLS